MSLLRIKVKWRDLQGCAHLLGELLSAHVLDELVLASGHVIQHLVPADTASQSYEKENHLYQMECRTGMLYSYPSDIL